MAVASGSSLLVRSKVLFGYSCWPFIKKHTKKIGCSAVILNKMVLKFEFWHFFGFGEVSENLKMALTWKLKGRREKFFEFFLFIQMRKSSKFSEKLELVIYHHLPDFLRKWLLTLFDIGGGGGHDGPQNVFHHCAHTLTRRKLKLCDF